MDNIEGTNLRRYMRETGKTFTQEEALGLMRPILLAVDAMHRKNVLHRDISPENLIRSRTRTLTLIRLRRGPGLFPGRGRKPDGHPEARLRAGGAVPFRQPAGSLDGIFTPAARCSTRWSARIQPQDAAARARKDDLLTLDEIEGVQVTERFARIIEKGMTIHATKRYASIRALMAELYGSEGQTEKCRLRQQKPLAIEKAFSPECAGGRTSERNSAQKRNIF